MNREIKLRGWNPESKKFYEPIIYLGEWYRTGRDFEDGTPSADPIMQFTGLQDKNGKDIYESDIVVSFKKSYEDMPTTNVVEFCKGSWRLICKGVNDVPLFNYSPKELQVIGNQYESPELINK